MTAQSRSHRIGWLVLLAVCTAMCLLLMLKVHAVKSDVVRADRQIVRLEQEKLLLETEFETRANLLQLSAWNEIDFGYVAPEAGQFIEDQRQLATLGSPRAPGAPTPIRVARADGGASAPRFPRFVSPLTGKPMDEALLEPAREQLSARAGGNGPTRIQLSAIVGSASE